MKYLDKVFKTNADGDQYLDAYKIEISPLELTILESLIDTGLSETTNDFLYKKGRETLNALKNIKKVAEKGFLRNIELIEI